MAARSNATTRGTAQRWRFGGPERPPVKLEQIRGEVFVSMDLAWPAIVWNSGRCWAHLHDLDPRSLACVMEALRSAELDRSSPHGQRAF